MKYADYLSSAKKLVEAYLHMNRRRYRIFQNAQEQIIDLLKSSEILEAKAKAKLNQNPYGRVTRAQAEEASMISSLAGYSQGKASILMLGATKDVFNEIIKAANAIGFLKQKIASWQNTFEVDKKGNIQI